MLLGKKPDDFDVATNATPRQVLEMFRYAIPTGIEHGTVTIPFKGSHFECTTFRAEQGYSDGRHPDKISFATTIEEDLSRRDFTMNAIAVSIPQGTIIDPFHGKNDISASVIRTVGNPLERFSEDGLRPLRAIRFSSQLGFQIHENTIAAIPATLSVIAKVSIERIRDEFIKILLSKQPSSALRLMENTGIMRLLLPELSVCRGVIQKGLHVFDVLDHLLAACDACPIHRLDVLLATLFHDIGKPLVREIDENGEPTFYLHEKKSAEIAVRIMNRMKFPVKLTKEVSHLIENHMFHYEPCWTDAAVRRFIGRIGYERIETLFAVRYADSQAITGKQALHDNLDDLRQRIKFVSAQGDAISVKDLAISGNDIVQTGIQPGPIIGLILKEILEAVIDDPSLNTKEKLVGIAQEIQATRYQDSKSSIGRIKSH